MAARALTILWCLVMISGPGLTSADAQQANKRFLIFEDADISGFDYETLKDVTLDGCRAACLGDGSCKAFTYNVSARWCFKKSGHGDLTTFDGAISGRVVAGLAPTKTAAKLDLSFLPSGFDNEARRFGRQIAKVDADRPLKNLLNEGRRFHAAGDMRAARDNYAAALAVDPDNAQSWLMLARTLLSIQTDNYTERYRLPEEATSAIINALPLATESGQQAYGLRLLAHALERRQLWRPAMATLTASLEIETDEESEANLARLRSAHGFRMVDYSVDSDAVSPRFCVQFSEDLVAKGTDYADFVTLDGSPPPAVTRETRQICIDGLTHGTRYRVTLRKGLPAKIGETLEKPVDLSLYVRDRAPTIKLSGNAYVLPKTGAKGIPVVTINTDLVKAEIFRIGERALAQTLRGGNFLSQLSGYRTSEITSDSGTSVWTGEMPVAATLNKEVVTAFPIDDVLPDLEPGAYVLVAKPDKGASDEWDSQATQWFIVTDIGLAALNSGDGVHVFARSLTTAAPIAGVQAKLIARNNVVLATATTDALGHVIFPAGMARGEGGMSPAMVTADGAGADFAFLDLTRPSFDLTDRGVEGRPAPGPLDVFMVPERGVYRPGETVHLLALLRDGDANAQAGVPLTFVVDRPDGVEYSRTRSQSAGLGGHAHDVALGETVMTGTWVAKAYADPKSAPLSEIKFLVEDFVPERLEFTILSPQSYVVFGEKIELNIKGRYLFGAPAADLRLEGEISIAAATGDVDGFAGYRFGLADEDLSATRAPLGITEPTDAEGRANIIASLPPLPETTGRLEAVVSIRMREPGGRAVARKLTLPLAGAGPLIGIKPQFDDDGVSEGATAGFHVRAMDQNGQAHALGGASWQLLKLDRNYQWYRLDGRWQYEPVTRTSVVADGRVELATTDAVQMSAPVKWGRYRLEVTGDGPGAPVTSVEFNAGWYVANASAETPDSLDVALDKSAYRPGEVARLRLSPRHAGKALVTVINGGLVAMQTVDVPEGGTVVNLEVGDDWGAGAYVTATLYRPMDVDAGHNPARALGLDWLAIDNSARSLGVEFGLPDIARPDEQLILPVTLIGLKPGEAARITVAAVDAGILSLTGYKPPRPSDWFFGQRQLGAEFRDLYGQLIDGLQGTRGTVRSGGDGGGLQLGAAPKTEKPVSLFSGIVGVDGDGKAEVVFDIPPFNGTLRLMAVAWTAKGVGQGTADLIVRDPVVLTSSLPRFLAPDDVSRLRLDISNLDGPAGEWTLDVTSEGPVTIGAGDQGRFALASGARFAAEVPITATGAGDAIITATLSHPEGMEIARAWDLKVRAAQPPVSRRNLQVLAASGGRLTVSMDVAAEFVAGTAHVSVTVSRGLFSDLPGLLTSLDRYPYGCAEQTTSRALPLLYVNEIAREAGLGTDKELRARVENSITRVLQYQGSNGSFGLWGPGGNDLWLDAYVTDFLSRARELGYRVPGTAFGLALDRLENGIAFLNDIDGGQGTAYALYVLARNARASLGDLRYYADARLDEFVSPMAKAQLGGALALMGDKQRANSTLVAAFEALREPSERHSARGDYGSTLRDGAALLTIAAEAGTGIAMPPIARFVEKARGEANHTSTQENAWMLLAANGLMDADKALELSIDGAGHRGRLTRVLSGASLAKAPLVIENISTNEARSIVTVSGVPSTPEPPRSNGISISRSYFAMDGTPVLPGAVGQNERLVVVLKIEEHNDWPSRLLVADLLPAGLEIENPRLVGGEDANGSSSGFDWLGEVSRPTHTEFRDDRFVASFEKSEGEGIYKLAYIVRAVSPGSFAHPPAIAEDMYRPGIEGRTSLGRMEVIGPRAR